MTTFITGSILNGTTTLFEVTAADINFVVLPSVTLVTGTDTGSPFDWSVFASVSGASNASIAVHGTIASNAASIFLAHGTNHSVSVGSTGVVTQMGSSHGIYVTGASSRISNAGEVAGGASGFSGIFSSGDGSDVVNTGRILSGFGAGVSLQGNGSSLSNTGTIVGFIGVTLTATGSDSITLFNGGSILAEGNPATSGVWVVSGQATVTNTGTIASASGRGITTGSDTTLVLHNSGTISGHADAIVSSGDVDSVTNRGTIIGAVDLGGGDDLFDNLGGTVTGSLTGGAGNDVFRLDGMGVTLVELAGGGVDRIESAGSYDLAGDAEVENLTLLGTARSGFGNGKANVIAGNLGDNVLSGLGQRDTINGMSGDDRILGGDGDDVLSGGGDDDRLNGGFGKDKLQGGIGDDTLIGGAGSDELTGGADTDTFMFRRVADSGTTTASRDVILGFVSGEDIIDLASIDANANTVGNQAFAFIGTGAFTNVAGQLRFNTATADLLADVTGDGVADFAIRLTGVSVMQSGDIVL